MPSHGGRGRGLYASCSYDVTELSFTDNLQSPTGVILSAERLAARAYGAEKTLFFAGGATDAVQTALWSLRGKRFAFLGDMHKSFYAAARLFSLSFIRVKALSEIEKHAVDVLCVTAPDYYGMMPNMSEISAYCKDNDLLLVVDEAHGAHFAFSKMLPVSAATYADYTIHGMHKTLPVYTGGALLHVKERHYDLAKQARADVIGTSPSYLVMSSMDYARDLFEREGETLYADVIRKIERIREKYPMVRVLTSDDPTRIVIERKGGGKALAAHLEKKGVFAEASDSDRIVLIVTPYNVCYLEKAFRLASKFDEKNTEYADISDLLGKVSAYDVGIYPPGVPLVLAGEKFTEDVLTVLGANLDRLFGTVDGKIVTK